MNSIVAASRQSAANFSSEKWRRSAETPLRSTKVHGEPPRPSAAHRGPWNRQRRRSADGSSAQSQQRDADGPSALRWSGTWEARTAIALRSEIATERGRGRLVPERPQIASTTRGRAVPAPFLEFILGSLRLELAGWRHRATPEASFLNLSRASCPGQRYWQRHSFAFPCG